jgi:hypothetical protein
MVEELKLPAHWHELLEAEADRPYFFEYCMMIESCADDIASSPIAMNGVFSYDQN